MQPEQTLGKPQNRKKWPPYP